MEKWAAIFDWDGVVIDSSPHHQRSWKMLAEEEALRLSDERFRRSFGMKNNQIIPDVFEWTTDPAEIDRLSSRKEVLYREVIAEEGIDPLPGVSACLESLRDASVPCAVASSTDRLNIECGLEITGLGPFFSTIVSAEDVVRGKPDPEVFLAAARKLGVPPDHCVVFEDAPPGIDAARAGGMKVVAVTTTRSASELQGAHRVVDRLDELPVADLQSLVL